MEEVKLFIFLSESQVSLYNAKLFFPFTSKRFGSAPIVI